MSYYHPWVGWTFPVTYPYSYGMPPPEIPQEKAHISTEATESSKPPAAAGSQRPPEPAVSPKTRKSSSSEPSRDESLEAVCREKDEKKDAQTERGSEDGEKTFAPNKGTSADLKQVEPAETKGHCVFVLCGLCKKWVTKQGFAQHTATAGTCLSKQKSKKIKPGDVRFIQKCYRCAMCYQYCDTDPMLRQHLQDYHSLAGLQPDSSRSRTPSDAMPSKSSGSKHYATASQYRGHRDRPRRGRKTSSASPIRRRPRQAMSSGRNRGVSPQSRRAISPSERRGESYRSHRERQPNTHPGTSHRYHRERQERQAISPSPHRGTSPASRGGRPCRPPERGNSPASRVSLQEVPPQATAQPEKDEDLADFFEATAKLIRRPKKTS